MRVNDHIAIAIVNEDIKIELGKGQALFGEDEALAIALVILGQVMEMRKRRRQHGKHS